MARKATQNREFDFVLLTVESAKLLKPGTVLYHTSNRNADGTPQRWTVNGAPKVWKRDAERVEIPLKHGLYAYDRATQNHINYGYVAVSYTEK